MPVVAKNERVNEIVDDLDMRGCLKTSKQAHYRLYYQIGVLHTFLYNR